MAKKKLELDKFNIDDELDFDFNMDDIEGQINPDVKKSSKRKAVEDVFTGTISGAKSKLTDPSFIAKVTKEALPEQYGEIFSTTDKVSSSLSSLYDETIREIKPEMSRLAKKVDRLVPEESKFFKKLSSKFSELIGNEASGYKQPDKGHFQEEAIKTTIASIFQEQNTIESEEKARDSAQAKIDEAVDQKRFTTNVSILRSIDQGISRLSQYNDKVTQAYQKKSLELQYRSYFIQSELLDTNKKYFEVFKAQNEGITKNTALPEFVKITKSEMFKEQAANKFIGSMQKSLFGDNDIFGTAVDRLKKKTKETVSNFKQAMEMGLMGLDELESMQEMQRTMADSGLDMGSKESMLGNVIGSSLLEQYGLKFGKKLRGKFGDETKVGDFGYKAANFLKNIPGQYNNLKQSKYLKDWQYEGGAKEQVANAGNFILDLFRPETPDMTIKGASNLNNINDIAPGFTNKAIKSITDVIPGYLARIYREVAMLRSGGDNVPLSVYDYSKNQFTTQTELSKDIRSLLKSKASKSTYESYVDRAINSITYGVELDPKTKERYRDIIKQLATSQTEFTPEAIRESDIYKGSSSKFIFDELIKNKASSSRGQFELTSAMTDVQKAAPNLLADIETFVNAGYGDMLEEQGLLKRGPDGRLEVDMDAYKKLINDTTVSSDVNVKRNIKSLNPKDALEAVKNTKVYNWFYKLGKGDQQPHTGPMAQDVNANLGEEAAPGGTKIDLTTMNGVNMAAIQALKEEQDKLHQSDKGQSILEQIKGDTSIIVELLQKGSSGSYGTSSDAKETLSLRKGFFSSVVDPTIKGAFSAINRLFSVSQSVGQGIKEKGINPFIEFVSKSYGNNKDWIKDSFKTLFTQAGDLASKVLEFGKTTLFETIPDSVRSSLAFGSKLKDQVKSFLNKPISIYLSGDLSNPILSSTLMKMGYYYDQTTGKVIQSIDDIKGPVVDKTGEVVLSIQQLAQGLVDKEGTPIKTTFEKLVGKAFNIASTGFKRVKDFYGNIANAALPARMKSLFTSSSNSLSSDKSYNVLVDIRTLLENHLTGQMSTYGLSKAKVGSKYTKPLGKAKKAVKDTVGGIKADVSERYKTGSIFSLFGSLKDKYLSSTKPTDEVIEPDQTLSETEDAKSTEVNKGKVTFNDRDGSGRRDGDWRDRLDALKNKAKEKKETIKADLKERYRGENVIDLIGRKVGDLLSFFSKNGKSLFGSVSDIVTSVGASLGLGKLGGLFSKAKNIGKGGINLLGKAAKGGLDALTKIGKPALNILSKAKNVASVARIGSVLNVGRTALMAGSLVSGGTLGAIAAGASTVLTALAGALASPVVLGTAVTAAVGYGAYKLYKYATRDTLTPFESIRIKQYGLNNSEADKHHNHELLALEDYLDDGRIGYEEGKAYILSKKVDMEEMLSIFSIDANDDEVVGNFTRWFEYRFKPFFLNHLTALFAVNNKIKLKDIKDLSTTEKSKYLGMIGFESGPYDVTVSPFKDIDRLTTDYSLVSDTITTVLDEVKKELSSKDRSPMDVARVKMAEVKRDRDPKYWKNKADQNRLASEKTEDDVKTSRSAAGILLDKGKEIVGRAYESTKTAVSQAYQGAKEVAGQAYEKTKAVAGKAIDFAKENIVTPIKNSLAGIIQRAESGRKGYNAYNRGTSGNKILGPVGDRNLTGMTLSQILEDSKRSPSDPQRLFAVGKYQMIPTTLKDGIKRLGINPDVTLYNEATQERLFSDYLLDKKRPKIAAFIKGKSDNSTAALNDAANEWASLPDPRTGSSKYGHGNKSSVTVPTLLSALEQSRNLYKQYIASGMPEREAYQKAVSTDGSGSEKPLVSSSSVIAGGSSIQDKGGPTVENATASKNPMSVASANIVDNALKPVSLDTSGYGGSVTAAATETPIDSTVPSKPETSSLTSVPAPSYTGTTSTGQGQGLNSSAVESSLNRVGETLTESLSVQKQMLETLREMLANGKSVYDANQNGLKPVSNQSKSSAPLSKPGVDLARKSA